jgi:hypothetical protein
MASKQFNSVDGYSTGNSGSTINVIDAAGNITASGSITRNSRNVPTVVHQANTPPSSPLEGDQWYNTTTGVLFEYLNDGTSSQWVDVNGLPGVVGPILFPGGTANAVVYLNSSSETATSSSFVFDGTNVTAPRFTSTVATGTSPLVVSSTTVVANLNANALQGSTPATANTASTIALRDANGNISANFFIGNGSQLTGISGGGGGASISNGTSNVNIATSGGNVTTSVAGNANILVVTGTGANIAGTLQVSGVSNLGPNSNVIITGGASGQVLGTDGAGNLSWVSPSAPPAQSVTTVTGNTTMTTSTGVYFANGLLTLTLPAASGNAGVTFYVKNINTAPVTVTGINTIDGDTDIIIQYRNSAITLISDGTNWNIF